MSRLFGALAIAGLLTASAPRGVADVSSFSPDKEWQFTGGDEPKIARTSTNQVALELSDACTVGSPGESTVLWAPDSKRFAFNCGQGRQHSTYFFQLSGDEWKALKSPYDDDEILNRAKKVVAAQLKLKGLPKKTELRFISYTLKLHQWVDSNTAILYSSLGELLENKDFLGFGASFLFTLKFDEAGNWKIVKTHRLSDKEAEKFD
jgi:hypothetical protein